MPTPLFSKLLPLLMPWLVLRILTLLCSSVPNLEALEWKELTFFRRTLRFSRLKVPLLTKSPRRLLRSSLSVIPQTQTLLSAHTTLLLFPRLTFLPSPDSIRAELSVSFLKRLEPPWTKFKTSSFGETTRPLSTQTLSTAASVDSQLVA